MSTKSEPPQRAAANSLIEELVSFDLNRRDAAEFAKARPDVCRRELDYLKFILAHNPDFKFKSSQGAYLRTSIEQEYGAPPGYKEELRRQQKAEAKKQADAIRRDKEARRVRLWPEYVDYLRELRDRLVEGHSDAYRAFLENDRTQVEKYERLGLNTAARLFVEEEATLLRLQEYFRDYEACSALDFSNWETSRDIVAFPATDRGGSETALNAA